VKAARGKAAQEVARKAGLKRAAVEDVVRLEELKAGEGDALDPDYAAKQAKAIAKQLFATASGIKNAEAVAGKLLSLPEFRSLEIEPLRGVIDRQSSVDSSRVPCLTSA